MKFYALEPHVDGTKKYAIGEEREVENEHDVKHLVDLKVLSTTPPKSGPDYAKDNLKALDLKKASKAQLLVIAAYEQADVPQADGATEAELIAAIEKKRKG